MASRNAPTHPPRVGHDEADDSGTEPVTLLHDEQHRGKDDELLHRLFDHFVASDCNQGNRYPLTCSESNRSPFTLLLLSRIYKMIKTLKSQNVANKSMLTCRRHFSSAQRRDGRQSARHYVAWSAPDNRTLWSTPRRAESRWSNSVSATVWQTRCALVVVVTQRSHPKDQKEPTFGIWQLVEKCLVND